MHSPTWAICTWPEEMHRGQANSLPKLSASIHTIRERGWVESKREYHRKSNLKRISLTLRGILIFLTILAGAFQGTSQTTWQYNRDVEKPFSTAVQLYTQREFREAAALFEELTTFPLHQRTTASYVMLGKSLLGAKRYRESVAVLKRFIDRFPESGYLGDAYYTLGVNYMIQRRYDDALVQFLLALEVASDRRTQIRALSLFETVADERLSLAALEDILHDLHNAEPFDLLSLKIAEKHLASGNIIRAERTLEPVLQRRPPTKYLSQAQGLRQKMTMGANVKIGVLLPLMQRTQHKSLKEFGEDFLFGMQQAFDEKPAQHTSLVKITMDVRDTEQDAFVAMRHTQELADDPSVVAIAGPIFSNEATSAGGIANTKRIPLISPTANADGIAAIGPYVFQANPDFTTRGRAAAQYAVTSLGMHTVAVLAPNEDPGRSMAVAFEQEAVRNGARVVAMEWYPAGATDLREQYMRMRRTAMIEAAEPLLSFDRSISAAELVRLIQAGANPRLIDSLMERRGTIGVFSLFGPGGKRIADSLGLPISVPEPKIDSLENSATGIQGIFMPIASHEEIGIVTSQLAYYAIRTQILGSPEWYDVVELDANGRYTDGVIFFSDTYVDPNDSLYGQFVRKFFEKHRKRPSKNVLFGYATARLVLAQIFQGAMTRDQLASSLSRVEGFPALHSTITLTNNRVNSNLHVLQYKRGEVRKLSEIAVH